MPLVAVASTENHTGFDSGRTVAPEVSVCIANWNCTGLLRKCLHSLFHNPQGVRFEVVVVDNASTDGAADMVIGSRPLGAEPGSLTPVQRFGNALSCWLIRRLWGVRFTDLGPFRAITRPALARLEMQDRNFGWTVEMQVRAAGRGLRCAEIPVSYRRRIGQSKVSGTISGSVKAGVKILWVIGVEALRRGRR